MAAKKRKPSTAVATRRASKSALGGAMEGAAKNDREMVNWRAPMFSADRQINYDKPTMDARGVDIVQNDGRAMGAMHTYKDSMVGAVYTLNATPDYEFLGLTDAQGEELSAQIEGRFRLLAESEQCWFDQSRTKTFSDIIRLTAATHFMKGESTASVGWVREVARPFKTAIQMIDPDRLSNPNDESDTEFLRRGVLLDSNGAPQHYFVRKGYPTDAYVANGFEWEKIPARMPWGRPQFIHIREQMRPGQTRGIAAMVSVLKTMRMTKKFSEIVLQNAVVNATYAAAIESDMPREIAMAQMGEANNSLVDYATEFLGAIDSYTGGSSNINIDGVKIPHLFPGTKLTLKSAGQPGGIGTGYEESLHRHIAAALGISYEQYANDFSKTNYSSGKLAVNQTERYILVRKKVVTDRKANIIYRLWLEEEIANRRIILPRGAPDFWQGINSEAYCRASWIGSGRGQVDELKETEAAVLRIKAGLSTFEIEAARLGRDFRDMFKQRARENRFINGLGLEFGAEKTEDKAAGDKKTAKKDPKKDKEADA